MSVVEAQQVETRIGKWKRNHALRTSGLTLSTINSSHRFLVCVSSDDGSRQDSQAMQPRPQGAPALTLLPHATLFAWIKLCKPSLCYFSFLIAMTPTEERRSVRGVWVTTVLQLLQILQPRCVVGEPSGDGSSHMAAATHTQVGLQGSCLIDWHVEIFTMFLRNTCLIIKPFLPYVLSAGCGSSSQTSYTIFQQDTQSYL